MTEIIKETLKHFGYWDKELATSTVYAGKRNTPLQEILEKIPEAKLVEADKKVRITIEYDPDYERFLVLVTDT